MSGGRLDTPLLGLLRRLEHHDMEMPIGGFVGKEVEQELDARSVQSLLEEVLVRANPFDRVERFWMARLLVDLEGREDVADVDHLINVLGDELLRPYEKRNPGSTSTESLRSAVRLLQPGAPIPPKAVEHLGAAFHRVQIRPDATDEHVEMSGSGAELASLMIELATGGSLHCDMSTHQEIVGATTREVIKVEVDTCTYRSFEDCKRSIDPISWPKVNPFFQSVTMVGPPTKSGPDWCGTIKESVGPGVNGETYTTDLAVTYVERPGMAVTAFDLAADRHDDGRVSVDRGFLSCTDEGAHRRIRTLKVYRIEDLSMPSSWICPLWSSQFALAAYWGGS